MAEMELTIKLTVIVDIDNDTRHEDQIVTDIEDLIENTMNDYCSFEYHKASTDSYKILGRR